MELRKGEDNGQFLIPHSCDTIKAASKII